MTRLEHEQRLAESRIRLAEALARCDMALKAHAEAVERLNQSNGSKERLSLLLASDRDDARQTGRVPIARTFTGTHLAVDFGCKGG